MTDSLLSALQTCDMVEIDGLYTFDFQLNAQTLRITCLDGRAPKHWVFSLAQLQAATRDDATGSWTLSSDAGEHRLLCMHGSTGDNDNNDEDQTDEHA
ncbi:DUF5629 family protein [Pseudomonas sp. MUP55]|uniref:DUF5629 family protein n=1 Tax=Pseudomonas sp. MUP55 TaxID=3087234 RepID=UPI002A5A5F77|nr:MULTISPECIES: DUF5629 family protein [unclassified Pseudomonas]WPN94955.1 DUF5629 family protein [Pseudomonas sp. MUP56]WPO00482.1 DUF5629 family protein [Pseudomonas sp. MUP55]